VRNAPAWVVAEKQPDNTLRVTAIPSRSLTDRAATLTVVAANPAQGEASFVVTQAHGTPVVISRMLAGGIAVRHVSENGRWAAGQRTAAVVVVDIHKLLDDPDYTGELLPAMGGVLSVDNNGKPYLYGCSADGSIYTDVETKPAVDKGPGKEFFPSHATPYIMRNGRPIDLNYPSTYVTSNIPPPRGRMWHGYMGCYPDKMSADGKYIYGRLRNLDYNIGWFACKWTRRGTSNEYDFRVLGQDNDADYTSTLNYWDFEAHENPEGDPFVIVPGMFLCPQNISGLSMYGKYACGHYSSAFASGGTLFRYDMETDELEQLNYSGIALHITDDGTLFDSAGRVHELGAAAPITMRDWLTKIYGENIASEGGPSGIGSVSAGYTTTILYNPDISQPTASHIITVEP
jgi:hypothetical protein